MSVVVTVAPTTVPIAASAAAFPIAPIMLLAGIAFALYTANQNSGYDQKCVTPPLAPPRIGSHLNSNISAENKQLIDSALHRIEAIHNIPISKWSKDFLNIRIVNSNLILEVIDINKTTLRTKENLDAFLRLLDQETRILVQNKLYSDITAKAESKGLELQAEMIEDDDTIVLTYRIP